MNAKNLDEATNIYVEDETLLKIAGINKPLRSLNDVKSIVTDLVKFLALTNVADAYKE